MDRGLRLNHRNKVRLASANNRQGSDGDRVPGYSSRTDSGSAITANMAPVTRTWPALARPAPRFSQRLFTCCRCRYLRASVRPQSADATSTSRWCTTAVARELPRSGLSSPLSSLSQSIKAAKDRKRYFPDVSEKIVAYWLLGSAASVFGIVVFGGLTRLTESGYSLLNHLELHLLTFAG